MLGRAKAGRKRPGERLHFLIATRLAGALYATTALLALSFRCDLGAKMELAGSGYLYTVAVIAVTFAGFSGMTMIFRQILGEHFTRLDSFVVRSVIQLGLMSVFACLVPPLLAQFEIAVVLNWRISSAILAIVLCAWSVDFPRRRHAASAVRIPVPVWCVISLLYLSVIALAAEAAFPSVPIAIGIYCTAATFILMTGGLLFLFSLTFLFPLQVDPPAGRSRPAADGGEAS